MDGSDDKETLHFISSSIVRLRSHCSALEVLYMYFHFMLPHASILSIVPSIPPHFYFKALVDKNENTKCTAANEG